jgi:hypothetical protein
MIYYRKTLFGSGPKLTAVQSFMDSTTTEPLALRWLNRWVQVY